MFIEILKAILFGIIEGICEWLPVSSTGHLILLGERLSLRVASELGGDFSEHFENMFNFVIQLGAILAVGILYWESFNVFSKKKSRKEKTACLSLAGKVMVASIPAAVVGILGDKLLEHFTGRDIDGYFYNSFTVAVMLIVYGLLFILTEGLYRNTSMKNTGATADSQIGIGKAFAIGCFQALSVIPGTSRSGATILGARLLGVERRAAAEFSFFLGIPAIAGASIFKAANFAEYVSSNNIIVPLEAYVVLFVASAVAFLVSAITIKALIGFVKKHSFAPFGIYRVILGAIILLDIKF